MYLWIPGHGHAAHACRAAVRDPECSRAFLPALGDRFGLCSGEDILGRQSLPRASLRIRRPDASAREAPEGHTAAWICAGGPVVPVSVRRHGSGGRPAVERGVGLSLGHAAAVAVVSRLRAPSYSGCRPIYSAPIFWTAKL